MQILRHGIGQSDTSRLRGFRHFIADRIHDHARMVIVLGHQISQIITIVRLHFSAVVVAGLVDVPAVHILVEHQHAQSVIGVKQRLGTRIVRGTDGIITAAFQQRHLAFLGSRICACTQQSVVMVEAATTQDHTFAIDTESPSRITFHRTHAEDLTLLVITEPHHTGVEIRLIGVPQANIGNHAFLMHEIALPIEPIRQRLELRHGPAIDIKNAHIYDSRMAGAYVDRDASGTVIDRRYAHAVGHDMSLRHDT